METKQYLKQLTEENHQQIRAVMRAYNEKVNKEIEKFIIENNLQEAIAFIYTTYEPWCCSDFGYDVEQLAKRKYNWDVYLEKETCTILFMPNTGAKHYSYNSKEALPFRLLLAENKKPQ